MLARKPRMFHCKAKLLVAALWYVVGPDNDDFDDDEEELRTLTGNSTGLQEETEGARHW